MNENYTEFILDDTVYTTQVNKKFTMRKKFNGFNKSKVTAFIPGAIREVLCVPGQKVLLGEKLLILEAMKMKNLVNSPSNGTVKEVYVKSGDMVSKNQLLVEITPD